jgi:hypothetical protein
MLARVASIDRVDQLALEAAESALAGVTLKKLAREEPRNPPVF